jgi:hypothetical protein
LPERYGASRRFETHALEPHAIGGLQQFDAIIEAF